jgi:hypothetical protein
MALTGGSCPAELTELAKLAELAEPIDLTDACDTEPETPLGDGCSTFGCCNAGDVCTRVIKRRKREPAQQDYVTLHGMPEDVLAHIFSYVDFSGSRRLDVLLVCKKFATLASLSWNRAEERLSWRRKAEMKKQERLSSLHYIGNELQTITGNPFLRRAAGMFHSVTGQQWALPWAVHTDVEVLSDFKKRYNQMLVAIGKLVEHMQMERYLLANRRN